MSDLVIDFTPLMADGKRFAVYIKTEEDAYEFLKQYKESFPHKLMHMKEFAIVQT